VGKNWFMNKTGALSKFKVLSEIDLFFLVGTDSERKERVDAFIITSVSNHNLPYCHLHIFVASSLHRFIIPSLDRFITLLL
jgi:hypothetical protein